jgi:hypothetical protein
VVYALNFEYDLMNKVMRVVKENNLKITHQKLELNCKFHVSVRKKEAKNIFEIFDDVYAKSDVTVDELIAVQHLMQNLDPVGTCADGIKESLIIQLQNCDLESSIIQKSCIVINEFFKEYTDFYSIEFNRKRIEYDFRHNDDFYVNLLTEIWDKWGQT